MVVKTTSIPRLELNAVVLLNRLLSWTRCAVFRIERFNIRMDRLYDNISMFETTSLQMEHVCCQPSLRGADFVSRRDMAACSFEGKPRRLRRGLSASSHDLWWKGLPWLKGSSTTWPRRDPEMSDEQTAKVISTEAQKVIVHHADCTNEWKLPKRYSSWTRLVRVTAYVLRFIKNSQRGKNSQPRKRLPIEVSELREATHRWFRLVQKVHFSKKWSALSKNEPISNSSALKALKSMLGEDSLFCLGRRLQNTALEYGEISYYIAHRISELLIDCALLCIEILEINENRLSRWQLVQAIQKQIWRSWSKDCLHSLQVRNKWLTSHSNIKINDLVIVRNLQLPPSRWELAHVIQVHPSSDGHVRVDLSTASAQ